MGARNVWIQALGALAAIFVTALLFGRDPDPPPGALYALVAFAGGAGAQWLYARWKYGKDVKVTFSRRIDD
jgi:drug/metabolite transporter (DMT)-like permease